MNATCGTCGHGRTALVALAVVGLAGCTEYGIVTTVDPDGSGSRIETVP